MKRNCGRLNGSEAPCRGSCIVFVYQPKASRQRSRAVVSRPRQNLQRSVRFTAAGEPCAVLK